MPRFEVVGQPVLTRDELTAVEMHSLLNMVNVVVGELYLLERASARSSTFQALRAGCADLARRLRDPSTAHVALQDCKEHCRHMLAALQDCCAHDDERLRESAENLQVLARIADARRTELLRRRDRPGGWETWECQAVEQGLLEVFEAQARHSEGAYGFVRDPAEKGSTDYLLDLRVASVEGSSLTLPPELLDVLRDLASNARKYCRPGGLLRILLVDDGDDLVLEVEDTGEGIPAEEIPHVVEFGFRGACHREGGKRGFGFGLTKAWTVARASRGRMWIESEVGRGTTVRIRIPRDEEARRAALRVPPPASEAVA